MEFSIPKLEIPEVATNVDMVFQISDAIENNILHYEIP